MISGLAVSRFSLRSGLPLPTPQETGSKASILFLRFVGCICVSWVVPTPGEIYCKPLSLCTCASNVCFFCGSTCCVRIFVLLPSSATQTQFLFSPSSTLHEVKHPNVIGRDSWDWVSGTYAPTTRQELGAYSIN